MGRKNQEFESDLSGQQTYLLLFCYYYYLLLFTQDSLFNEGPAFLAEYLQRSIAELALTSNFHHRRPHRGIELRIPRS